LVLIGAKISRHSTFIARSILSLRESAMSAGVGSMVAISTLLVVAGVVSAAEPSGKYAEVNGVKLYYETHGAARDGVRPLVVLHGAFGWAHSFAILGKHRQLIVVELQGHGHTPLSERPMSFESMADDVAGLLAQLKIVRADVFGYSMGGNVALALAIRHPDAVRKVALNGSNFRSVEEAFEPANFQQMRNLPDNFAPPPLKGHYDQVAPDPKEWPALVRAVKKMLLEFKGFSPDQMRSIKAEVLVTQGDRDGLRPEHAVEMFRLIPHAQLAIFPNGDHFMIFVHPEKLQSTVVAFLDGK
jgi:pimeloyl-ACP methyl ester carboxylesterase